MGKIRLTLEGINLLERHLVEAFAENPDEMQRAAKTLNVNLNPFIQKYLKRHFEIEEDLSLIRIGHEPKYNLREFYGLK